MRKSNQILQNFFYKINDHYILNVLYALRFTISIPQHQERIKEILNISSSTTSIKNLFEAVMQEIQYYEDLEKEDKKYIMKNRIAGKALKPINDTPSLWCFIALYWAYQPEKKDQDFLSEVYNHKIGDLALKFLLYFHKMKQKEENNTTKHKASFYEDLAPRMVRIIDILSAMNVQNNNHINKLYFPIIKTDLALNFLKTQANNPWEQTVFSVEKSEKIGKSVIIYKHHSENLNFTIIPTRTTGKGSLNDLNKTYNQLMKFYNLDLANISTSYSLGNKRKSSKKEVLPSIITPHEEELIYVDSSTDPEILGSEDQIEQKAKRKAYRRDMKDLSEQDEDSEEEVKEYVIPNAFQQHKRNIAFSSKLSKERLLLNSDYDIPIPEHLKSFIASLDIENKDRKIYTGFFILNVTLGCKIEDLLYLLQEKEEGSLQLKNDVITVKVDSSLFAKNYNKLLSQSENKLTFSIPIAMSALIVSLKKVFLGKEFNQVDFLEEYKEFIKSSVKQFHKSISIKHRHLYRYLAQYVLVNGKDVLTSKFSTAAYTQNDTAKLAYTSSRCNATEHSKLLKDYWSKLCILNEIVYKIIGSSVVSASSASSIASENFTGTSQSVRTDEANAFFEVLRQNIYDCNCDKELHFNLVSIYTRFAMSLLVGTRPFIESANFTSYDESTGVWGISEKAQDIASGSRLVPVCNTMKSILSTYRILLEDRGLKNNFYLIMDGKNITFSTYSAHKYLQSIPNLEDSDILEKYINNVPLNSGRHLFVRKAIDDLVNVHYISTYLGHYAAGEEQFGIYSTLNVKDYRDAIVTLTTKIAQECGIKEL